MKQYQMINPELTVALEELIQDLMLTGHKDFQALRLVNHWRERVRKGKDTAEELLSSYGLSIKHAPALHI
jgi:hypothetical protein